jgi:threonylcarbamoyladenosine tRNA methylthiotransferase MtaB
LEETTLPRLRLTSIAPWDLDPELLDLFSDARLCRHLHLSLQSGSTTVLRRMRRPYRAEQFADAVELARSKIPGVAITTDVIVGFPGEADVEFQESVEFVERMNFARVHVFPYSAREGTLAAQLPLHVSDPIKDERGRVMQRAADASQIRFALGNLGRVFDVLYEEQTAGSGIWSGYTDNYIRVTTRSQQDLGNRIVPTRLLETVEEGVYGEVLNQAAASL